MPAAAVIPALIAYIKVVAVKTLVVGSMDALGCRDGKCLRAPACTDPGVLSGEGAASVVALREQCPVPLAGWPGALASFTLRKLECS